MRRPHRPLRLLAISVLMAMALPLGCHGQSERGQTGEPKAKTVKLPAPLPLPAEPEAAAYLARPDHALAKINPWVQESVTPSGSLERALMSATTTELASVISTSVDPESPWAMVRLGHGPEAEEVIRLPLRKGGAARLTARVEGLEKEGRFGAVKLPAPVQPEGSEQGEARTQPAVPAATQGPWLLWIDNAEDAISLAKSRRGLVTGRELAGAYGDEPVFVTLDPAVLGVAELAQVERVNVHGELHRVDVSVKFVEGADPLAEVPLTEGAMTGLLRDPAIALGATSRWTGHKGAVKKLTRDIQRRVDGLNFLIKGTVQEMANKFYAALRAWDGRFFVALGPDRHIRVAYGSKEPEKAGGGVLRLLRNVEGNLELARNFTSNVPKMNLKKNAGKAGGINMHVLTVSSVRGQIPKEFRTVLDDKGKLRIAMAWSESAGGGMAVVGPQSIKVLETWLEEVADAPSGHKTRRHLAAGVVSISPERARAINVQNVQPGELLDVTADGDRYGGVFRRDPEAREISVRLRSPKAKDAPPPRRAPSSPPRKPTPR